MTPALIDQLRTKYPRILSKPIEIWCRDGWYDLLVHLFGVLEYQMNHLPTTHQTMHVSQLKEKFGTLRCYMSHHDPYMAGAIAVAESMSAAICEVCGSHHGELRTIGHWVQTLCLGDYSRLDTEWQIKQGDK